MAMVRVGVFDIETDGTDHWGRNRNHFFRIGALSVNGAAPAIYDYVGSMRYALGHCADVLVGHNVINFDLPAMYGKDLDLIEMAKQRKLIDTMVWAPLQDPAPWSYVDYKGVTQTIAEKPDRMLKFYKLDNLAHRYGFTGKVNDLTALAKSHRDAYGDDWDDLARRENAQTIYGTIPKSDTEYRDYLRGDIAASRKLAEVLLPGADDYAWRELIVAAIGAQTSINGFRLDQELAQAVVKGHTERNQRTLSTLAERYGVPLTDAKGRPKSSPLRTKQGKAALEQSFRTLLGDDVFESSWPKTPGKAWAWGGDVILEAAKQYGNAETQELARAVAEIGGTRTVFQTALNNVKPDGFCHSNINFLQRTGRSSVTDPGLTVFGKRNGRHRERGIFLPDVVLGDDYEPNTHVLFSVDLAQMDARVIGALSQDHAYLDLFEPGVDSHREVARMVWGDPSRREEAKPLSHGTNYGMGPDKLSREAGIPFEEAEAFQGKMAALFPRLEAWKHEVRDFGKANGWVGNGFGRKVMIDRNRSWTQAPAGAGQAGTRDILMQGAIDLYDVDPRILRMLKAMVHDEFVFSVPRKYAVEVRHIVVKTLSGQWCPPGASRPVPVVADASPFATRWSGCYEKG